MSLERLCNTPLSGVLTQLTFDDELQGLENPKNSSKFTEVLGSGFKFNKQQQVPAKVPSVEDSEILFVTRYVYVSDDGKWQLGVTSHSLSLELTPGVEYPDFMSFKKHFSVGLAALEAVGAPQVISRLGVRYVNTFKEDDVAHDPLKYFSQGYADLCSFVPENKVLNSSYHEISWAVNPEILTVRFGLLGYFPDKPFLLDFDCSREESMPYENNKIVKAFESCHEIIETEFIKSLNPEYLKQLVRGNE